MFNYLSARHAIPRNLEAISDPIIHKIVSKGPKYRFTNHIDFDKCREKIASALNDFGNRWCKREHVELDALKGTKTIPFSILSINVLNFFFQK